MKKKNITILAMLFLIQVAFSQEGATFSVKFENEPVSDALEQLENLYDVRFSFQDELVKNVRISLSEENKTLQYLLDEISNTTQLNFEFIDTRYIIVTEANALNTDFELLERVVVTGYLAKGIYKNKNATFTIKPTQLEILPGLIETDVLESIQLLPGVVSPNETASGFLVRGGEADQNRIIWNDINMYHKGHLFGMISAFNPNIIKDVKFANKGTHPRYGERISSVVDMSSGKKVANGLNVGIGLNGINADAFLEVPIVKNKLSIQSSVRRSYTEVYETTTFDRISRKVFQTTKIAQEENTNNDFNFLDYNLTANFIPNASNRFSASIIYIDNRLDNTVSDPTTNESFNDLLKVHNEGYGFNWDWLANKYVSVFTKGYISKYDFAYNFIERENEAQISDFEKKNVIFDSGFSSEIQVNTSHRNRLTIGYQYSLKDVNYAFLDTSELDFVLDIDRTIINTHSGYGNFDYRNRKLFDINIGARVNYYKELDAARLEPRVLVYRNIFKNLKLQLSGEIKNQIISEIDETVFSDLSLENKLWRLADGDTYPIINSKQVSLGFLYSNSGWSADLDTYYKTTDGITALSLGFLNPLDPTIHLGDRRVYGADFYLKKEFDFVKTWLSYSYNDVRSRFKGLNSEEYFTSNTNIRHSFTASVACQVNGFQLALAWNWRTGRPYTEALVDGNGNLFFDQINTKSLPEYHRLDLSTTYDFRFSTENKLRGKLGVSLRNVYDRENHLSKEYTGNNSLNDPIEVVDKFSLGFTPNFLIRMYW